MEYPETPTTFDESTELMKYVKKRMDQLNDASHDFRHILRVMQNVEDLLKLCPQDEFSEKGKNLARFAAIIHDMFDEKFLKSQEIIQKRHSELVDLLGETQKEFPPEDIIQVGKSISWSKYIKNGVPKFEGDLQKEEAWKIVSMADWMDGQLIIRCRDHKIYLDPRGSESSLKADVVTHWHEKLCLLHVHCFSPSVKPLMVSRFLQQLSVLQSWSGFELSP